MAQYPCDRCGRRYRGPSNRAYIAIYDGVERWDYKPRLCPTDVEELVVLFEDNHGWIDPTDTSPYKPQPCLVCAQSVDGQKPQSVFITLFTGRDNRRDGYAPVCGVCRQRAEALLEAL